MLSRAKWRLRLPVDRLARSSKECHWANKDGRAPRKNVHGMTLDEIVVEEGVSGFMPVSERAKGGALFVKLKAGDVVIAPKFDCLFRSLLDALRVVEDLKKRGVFLHLLDLGGDISGNGLSKLFLTIAAAFAEAERDRIRERIGQVKADQKARGRYLGGGRPFGFQLARTAISSPTKTSRRPSPRCGACGPRGRRCGHLAGDAGEGLQHQSRRCGAGSEGR